MLADRLDRSKHGSRIAFRRVCWLQPADRRSHGPQVAWRLPPGGCHGLRPPRRARSRLALRTSPRRKPPPRVRAAWQPAQQDSHDLYIDMDMCMGAQPARGGRTATMPGPASTAPGREARTVRQVPQGASGRYPLGPDGSHPPAERPDQRQIAPPDGPSGLPGGSTGAQAERSPPREAAAGYLDHGRLVLCAPDLTEEPQPVLTQQLAHVVRRVAAPQQPIRDVDELPGPVETAQVAVGLRKVGSLGVGTFSVRGK